MFEIVGREEQVLYQWEQGVSLSNPCMKAGDEVVFRNSSGATYVMIADASGVEVPNKLLQRDLNILVELGQGLECHSECQTVFEVLPEEKPGDYAYVDNTIRGEQPSSAGWGMTVLYGNWTHGPYAYKTTNYTEEDKLTKDELMAIVRRGMVVIANVGDGYEEYYYATEAGTSDEDDYAWVSTRGGGDFCSKEYVDEGGTDSVS